MITASVVLYRNPVGMVERLIGCVMRSVVGMLYVVDNAPGDVMARLCEGHERICYIANDRNEGYGRGHNRAIRMATGAGARYHMVLNPDIYWDADADVPGRLRDFMEAHPQCGLSMPRITWPDGRVQPLCKLLPKPGDLFRRRFLPDNARNRSLNNRFELETFGYDRTMEVPSLSGCFMFMRCSTLKETGLFDERFFLYAEDVDLCRRIGCIASTVFVHSVSAMHEYQRGSYKSLGLLFHHIVSAVRYFNKWGWLHDSKREEANARCLARLDNQESAPAFRIDAHYSQIT